MNTAAAVAPPEALTSLPQAELAAWNLLQIAVERGDPKEKIDQLKDLLASQQGRGDKSAFDQAFAAFQALGIKVIRNRSYEGELEGRKYADTSAITDAAQAALAELGLTTSWKPTRDEPDWIEITCTLRHVRGYSESASMGGPPDRRDDMSEKDARLSTATTLERRTLRAVLGLADQDEDQRVADGGPDAQLLAGCRAAAEGGQAALRKYVEENSPSELFWQRHGSALKKLAKQAEAAVPA